jgi:hypothetical protein
MSPKKNSPTQIIKAAGADTISATLIFLGLLKGKTQCRAEFF